MQSDGRFDAPRTRATFAARVVMRAAAWRW